MNETKKDENIVQLSVLEKVIHITAHDKTTIYFSIKGTPQEKVYAGFSPEMTMGSMTKGNKHIVTLFSDKKQLATWDWGIGGHTCVTDKIHIILIWERRYIKDDKKTII